MKLQNFFRSTKNKSSEQNLPEITATDEKTMIQEPEKSDTSKNTYTVSSITGWPIDIIYGYLHKNYEEQGYNDAMTNCNLSFRDMNIEIIRNKILMAFREINLKYECMRSGLQTRIDASNAACLLTTSAQLENQMAIIKSHKEELRQLEADFRENTNEASIPTMSYETGFMRGISSIALATPTQDFGAFKMPSSQMENLSKASV